MTLPFPGAIEIMKNKFYWFPCGVPKIPLKSKIEAFCTDTQIVYEPFAADFGPVNLACTHRYCLLLNEKLKNLPQDGILVHYTSNDYRKRANAAYLISAYLLIMEKYSVEEAHSFIDKSGVQIIPFRDAISGPCNFPCTILDCLRGLDYAMKLGWFSMESFDLSTYSILEKVENGDMTWIIPNKFLAFAGPADSLLDSEGIQCCTPEHYTPIFTKCGIKTVIRLNKKQYDKAKFLKVGIKHHDLFFLDGSCPSRAIIEKFLEIAESEPNAIAVHCKAGLGRTGTLIGLYAQKHFRFPAKAFIGWARICRPGSILGPQQQFLVDMQEEMFNINSKLNMKAISPALKVEISKNDIANEDVGQGEKLRQVRIQNSKIKNQFGVLDYFFNRSNSTNTNSTSGTEKEKN